MCGIFCACKHTTRKDELEPLYETIRRILNRRGPDYQSSETVNNANHTLLCAASVLWTQGEKLTKQPIIDNSSVFIYNGDLFGGRIPKCNEGDTIVLHRILKKSIDTKALKTVEGPYSFIYLDKEQSKLYFGRDPFGRRSLLIAYKDHTLILTSVAKKSKFNYIELPAIGVFIYDLKTEEFYLQPWEYTHSNFSIKFSELETSLNKSIHLIENPKIESNSLCMSTASASEFLQNLPQCKIGDVFANILDDHKWLENIIHLKRLLEKAVEVRVKTLIDFCRNCLGKMDNCEHCTVGVLFSGGIDCSILALMVDQFVHQNRSIDLLNVAFDAKASDRGTGLKTLEELRQLRPNRTWNFVEVDVLITGMGADELFGGYTKHRAAYKRLGWEGLHESLENDWQNISFRNLARDDRVVSDHGRQLRLPYLDENVVNFTRSLSCSEKTWPTDLLPQGVGEKLLLRSVAYHLGFRSATTFKKKALQFGSKIANSKENAHEISPRL
ncbi:hypothetical protein FQR65_LT03223 [Abscondita terminalis]|nr:hypothetical protein FQR65_LT03223 [Abscondita terminalis]